MASAFATPVASTKETTNYARLCRILVDVGFHALRDTFDRIHPPAGLHSVLALGTPAHKKLQSLKSRRILNPTQWVNLFPTIRTSVSSASFDITLLMVLLRNICGLTPPITGWDNPPSAADTSIEANIARVKYYGNTVYGHATQASIDDVTFNTLWKDISNPLVTLGGASYGAAINKLKFECMDLDTEEHYRELLLKWKKGEDNIKEKLKAMEVAFKEGQLSDLELDELAGKIAAKWETLGLHLGISQNVVEEIATNAKDKPRAMLFRWRNTSSSCTPYEDLYHALCHVRVGLDKVAKEFCCKIKERFGEVEGMCENKF
ncbi:uncharacterized protein LOC110043217 isoform X3 [Orbicella faveolata]|uniref:uncharacterized protein LOC110043217 isoform X3 n=1 Tax=Orbicella faveolata TaxID=48498 RepID=UPI0009E359CB|nr:uncharacterized protein LOC110043217 isoform X3 [Orbicella faveolata]